MRIRLLTMLALFLLGGATPLHASLGLAPQCLPASQESKIDGVRPLTADAQVIAHLDAEDRDYMIRTIVFEAAGEPEEGKIAVAGGNLSKSLTVEAPRPGLSITQAGLK